jgi:anti-anti-sigma regulatory factor
MRLFLALWSSATTFCDGAGARAILRAYQRSIDSGAEVWLVVTARQVRRMFDLIAVGYLPEIFPAWRRPRLGAKGVPRNRPAR